TVSSLDRSRIDIGQSGQYRPARGAVKCADGLAGARPLARGRRGRVDCPHDVGEAMQGQPDAGGTGRARHGPRVWKGTVSRWLDPWRSSAPTRRTSSGEPAAPSPST